MTHTLLKTQFPIILNPASAAGMTGRRREEVVRLFDAAFPHGYLLHITQGPLEASRIAADAIRNGAGLVVAIGGDGTVHEVVNGMLNTDVTGRTSCALGIISSGTGHGFADSLGVPRSWREQIARLASGKAWIVDLLRLSYQDSQGKSNHRMVVNECQLGIGGVVVRNVRKRGKRLGGRLAFGIGTLQGILAHKNQCMSVSIDGDLPVEDSLTGIVVANGAFTGAGMNLTPQAHLDDGLLDVLLMHNLSRSRRFRSFPKIYRGTHLTQSWFSYHQARSVTITSAEPVLVEADGELLGTTPCTLEVVPAAIRLRCEK